VDRGAPISELSGDLILVHEGVAARAGRLTIATKRPDIIEHRRAIDHRRRLRIVHTRARGAETVGIEYPESARGTPGVVNCGSPAPGTLAIEGSLRRWCRWAVRNEDAGVAALAGKHDIARHVLTRKVRIMCVPIKGTMLTLLERHANCNIQDVLWC
jgi:hypothetical protein